MKTVSVLLASSLLGFSILRLNAQVPEIYSFNNLNRVVPDGNASGLSDVRTIPSAIVNSSTVRLRLRITGEFNGDLYGYVRHIQDGNTNLCVLLNRVGRMASNLAGYADAGLDVLFDDVANQGDIHTYRAITNPAPGSPLLGSWRPDGRRVDPEVVLETTPATATLGSFHGSAAGGEWTLFLADLASGGTNMLLSWELHFIGVAAPVVSWPDPADIVYGTALGVTQLNASCPVDGTFSYDPPPGTVLNAGSGHTLSVTFTPADIGSYAPVTTNIAINVLKAPLTIVALNTNKVYGAPLPDFAAIYSGFVNGDTIEDLSSTATLTTTASAASPAGTYPITARGAASSNYAISYTDGTLLITKAGTAGLVASSANPSPASQPVVFTFRLGAIAPGVGTPMGTVQFKIDDANAGSPAALSNGIAAFTTATLPHGVHAVAAEYAGDGNFTGTTNQLSSVQLINSQPVAGPDTIERDPLGGAKVAITTLLANDFDADGDALSLVSISATSPFGGTVVASNGWVFYSPAAGFTNADTFTYTISDGWGAPVTGTVTVAIRVNNGRSPNLVISDLQNGSYAIRGDGIPGRTYRLQYADQVQPTNWHPLGAAQADSFGVFGLIDSAGSATRFYRSVYP
jgi:subtilisin-like proprotein convertase family protein